MDLRSLIMVGIMNNETALIAVIIIIGIFVLMVVSILKGGIDGAIKMWSLLGVAFGAIISFYFADKVKQKEIATLHYQAQSEVSQANEIANLAIEKLSYVKNTQDLYRKNLDDFKRNLEIDNSSRMTDEERKKLLNTLDKQINLNKVIDKSISNIKADFKPNSTVLSKGGDADLIQEN